MDCAVELFLEVQFLIIIVGLFVHELTHTGNRDFH